MNIVPMQALDDLGTKQNKFKEIHAYILTDGTDSTDITTIPQSEGYTAAPDQGMSSKYIALSLGKNSVYTCPANGWITMHLNTDKSGVTGVMVGEDIASTSTVCTYGSFGAAANYSNVGFKRYAGAMLPVRKGQRVSFFYQYGDTRTAIPTNTGSVKAYAYFVYSN